jgi:pullulanase-type alpha-1,6-glucosidase
VPEGSYATVQDGAQRILEFREMVKALSEDGLRVVMDMVFNHTFASGLNTQAVLDKVVPGYYHRYNNDGYLMNSSCCSDTATEFDMMQKLMIDTAILWVKAYKVDGFRFDLMNLIPADAMIRLRDKIRTLTPVRDGINGAEIYLYGEGWDFGSARDKGFYHANKYNMAGTGIGTFNDQIRDAIHGGYADDAEQIRQQGFINGQSYNWNGYFYDKRFGKDLRHTTDKLRIALAGSLQNYKIVDQNNNLIDGKSFNGSGYTRDPQETINYASSHDNETLFDLNVFKMPQGKYGMSRTSMEERVRSQNMAMSLVGLSQGIPSFHAGIDMLRSKSLDHNSYDSGDWFNRLDFTYHTNNFRVGLPPAWGNQSRWSIMAPLLADPQLKPTQENILNSVAHLQEILKIRKSSKLFRLETEGQIIARVKFHNTGSQQKDGLIAMSISDRINHGLDPKYKQVVVLFNANKFDQTLSIPEFKRVSMSLHPVQLNSRDPLVKTSSFNSQTGEFRVPGLTTAVFVEFDS